MLFGKELVEKLRKEIELDRASMADRARRINEGLTDMDDCFLSQRCEERGIDLAESKIALIEGGGCAWFTEYATLSGELVRARWCKTKFGSSLRVEMPDGSVVWTTALTARGLAKKGLKMVKCLRPAWFCFRSAGSGLAGVYGGQYVLFPSDTNYATGEEASAEPIEIKDAE